jgi:TM2 domain-containing membrane protein YozV
MSDQVMKLMVIEQRVSKEAPSTLIAYLLLLFLGFISAHRFYLGKPGSAICQIISYFFVVGWVWLFIDLFLVPGMIKTRTDSIRAKVTSEVNLQLAGVA